MKAHKMCEVKRTRQILRVPLQFILMVIKKDKNSTDISNPMFIHHALPINITKIYKIFPSKVCAITINISRSLL